MLKKLKNNNKDSGFTIIEVMIVLAIAGLILLIVFLAVPALQRSARNTSEKNDVSQTAAAVANFISNNGGGVPNTIAIVGGNSIKVSCAGAAGTVITTNGTTCTAGANAETAAISQITSVSVGTSTSTNTTADTIVYVPGYGCNSSETGLGTASTRTAALLYSTEAGGGNTNQQCIEQ
jgi:prepilin-type N-terminal cleavage/methylation domain-containing protein